MIKSLSNLLTDIENSKKRWKHTAKFENEVRQIIEKLLIIIPKITGLHSIKTNIHPKKMTNNWLKNHVIKYFELDSDDYLDLEDYYEDEDFRIYLGKKLKTELEICRNIVELTLYELRISEEKMNDNNKSSQQIFISYAREDSKPANKMYNALRSIKGLDPNSLVI